MNIDTAAQQALDIFSIGSESNQCGASITLHDHLNRCRSSSGKRLIRMFLQIYIFLKFISRWLALSSTYFSSSNWKETRCCWSSLLMPCCKTISSWKFTSALAWYWTFNSKIRTRESNIISNLIFKLKNFL